MAVPTQLSDLNVTIGSNPPAGTDSTGSPGQLDDYLRAAYGLIAQVNAAKAALASPTFTGTVTIPTPFTVGAVSVTATGTELNFVDGVTSAIQTQLNTKAPLASPTFTGTVAGITATMVGLGNVTNESKATMFTSPTFTTAATLPATAFGNNALTGIKTAGFNGQYDAGTGGSVTIDFANGQKQKRTANATASITLSAPAVGHYQLRLFPGANAITWVNVSKWLNSTDAPTLNTGADGNFINVFFDGTSYFASASKIGAA